MTKPVPTGDRGRSDQEILRRGLTAFSELGYDHTTVRELAARIGVSRNFVGDRFGSKSAFWFAVVDFACAEAEVMSTPDARLPDDEFVKKTIRGFYRNAARHPDLHRLLADEAARDSDRLTYLYDKYIEPSFVHIWEPIDRLTAAGRILDVPRHLLFFTIIGPTMAMTHAPLAARLGRHTPTDIDDLDRYADQIAELVIDGLFVVTGS
ncbi:TetR/AcrR family transcriptional regulator [Gordonia sp. CPCC 206044]|uniref:TetR/AcrR family transcriptional regulator n=1 Tax=Gordonia sp. CPCC 206044 TaxID=3140793 RepID=UPI003AF3C9F5